MREGWKDKLNEQKDEGCLVTGHLEVNKVAGNFHFAPGKSFQQHHVHGENLLQRFTNLCIVCIDSQIYTGTSI